MSWICDLLLPFCLSASTAQIHASCLCRFTQDELLAIDLEGRCVITDHGAFILFNLYGPAITSEESAEERFAYKLRLYQVRLLITPYIHKHTLCFMRYWELSRNKKKLFFQGVFQYQEKF